MSVRNPTSVREELQSVPYRSILIPIERGSVDRAALHHGLSLARSCTATVHILHVVETNSEGSRKPERIPEEKEWEAAGAIEQAIADVDLSGINVIPIIESGQTSEAIQQYVAENHIDLIVVSAHERGRIRELLFGPTSDQIIRTAGKPVLTVPPRQTTVENVGTETEYAEILVPTDGCNEAENAVKHCLQIAMRYDATLHGLFVIDRRAYTSRPNHTWEREVSAWERRGTRVLTTIEEKAANAGVNVRTTLIEGVPHREILTYASDNDIDLIGMGTRGLTGINRFLLGSVTSRVIKETEIPVLTDRPNTSHRGILRS